MKVLGNVRTTVASACTCAESHDGGASWSEVATQGIDASDIGKASCGQRVRTKVESFPSESFEGVVKRIDPMGKELNNVTTFEVRVTISNPQGKLRAKMTANAEIILDEHKKVLAIPATAVLYAPYGDSVFVIDEKKDEKTGQMQKVLRLQAVHLGTTHGDFVAVVTGLKAGEEKRFRLFKGAKGSLKEQKMTNVVSDSEGEIFSAKTGSLKMIIDRKQATTSG
jgi:hypothetical protein